jgi:carbon starvation protein
MAYWNHCAIMFEELFILTSIDTGTRVARFVTQEFLGKIYKPFERPDWIPGTIFASGIVVIGWSYFILTGTVSTIWPMFGIANQLLAVIALSVGTTVIINSGKRRYAWVTVLPLIFVSITTFTAGWDSIFQNFLPLAGQPGKAFIGYLNVALTAVMMTGTLLMVGISVRKWSSR